MKRWLMAAIVAMVVTGCGTAEGGPVSPGDASGLDAGTDAGRSVAEWQGTSAAEWRSEMGNRAAEMHGVIDRGSPADFNPMGLEMFRPALLAYRNADRRVDADAGLAERRAMVVRNTTDDIAPAYCRVADAFRLAALGHPLMQPEPRVRCSELPATDASRWWERWP